MGIGKWVAAGIGIAAIGGVAAYAQSRDSEEPDFEVIKEDKAFQLRDYGPIIVAEVTHKGDRRQASGRSFRRLAAYIFAQDRPDGGEAIAMTSPVIQERVNQDEKIAMTSPVIQEETSVDEWRMRFVMPAKYTMDSLPTAPEDITLTEIPARRMATVRFNGYARPNEIEQMEGVLTEWIAEQELIPAGDFEYAFYDAPMVPGRMRRNEVMIEVVTE